ncbi:hypothetical protein NLX86_25880 [Streptomyces sp. A3M-1-3]|uniref:hypothetical protein n=1 Tax=Streptomyces sp. A3M-1-3 TaxID=2962044 RepID=UPI0020B6E437|nr:hypothetical protein [Streptomyces sp. A3M-1-3]MCP3821400.1 hypothetical protein [Streptomyces sp. A3M-1-3]
MPAPRTDLSSFADALADRLPGHWTSEYAQHDSYAQQFVTVEKLWDTGHVDYIVSQYVLGHHAVLHDQDGRQLYLTDRPLYSRQFVVAPLEPGEPGIKPHHFAGVEEPNGITVPDQPTRAAAQVTRRLLPRYQQALDTVLHNAAVQPAPPHRPGPPRVADVVTLTWYEDGALGTPYKSVPEGARTTLYALGFQYHPHQAAFLLPAAYGEDGRALRLRALVHQLAQKGIGVNLRHSTTPIITSSSHPPVPALTSASVPARHR